MFDQFPVTAIKQSLESILEPYTMKFVLMYHILKGGLLPAC